MVAASAVRYARVEIFVAAMLVPASFSDLRAELHLMDVYTPAVEQSLSSSHRIRNRLLDSTVSETAVYIRLIKCA